MDDNGTYLVARCLQRAGQWDLAARHAPEGSVLRAEVLTDRHLWRLDPVGEACAAIRAIAAQHPDRAAFLTAQLEYWRRLAGQAGDPIGPDPVDTFQSLTGSRALTGWATFWHAVALDNLNGDASAAGPGYAQARDLAVAAGDGLLESYAVRHLAGQALDAGEPERAVPLARRSLHL
ncbi:MAG TPA: hypothetical protein VJT31_24255, partial [Rugosimonospora sp.]|nr:hypothetical protein [Rugosimonospora sp.]